MDEDRDDGLMGGEAVEVEDKAFEVIWGIEAEGKLGDYFEEGPLASHITRIKSNVYSATPSSKFQ